MCQSCEGQFGSFNGSNGVGDLPNVVVKSETERLAPERLTPEIVIKVEETANEDLNGEGGIGDFVAQDDDYDEEDEGYSYDEDSDITYSNEEEDVDDADVKPQNVDFLELIDPSPKRVSRRVAKKRGRRRSKRAEDRIPCDVCGRTFAESMPLALQVHKFKEHLINR